MDINNLTLNDTKVFRALAIGNDCSTYVCVSIQFAIGGISTRLLETLQDYLRTSHGPDNIP